jgi:hypothetical protein
MASADATPPPSSPPADGEGAQVFAPPGVPEWVGLKWLMSPCGHRLNVDRLQTDRPYALSCLTQALNLGDPVLARYAHALHERLTRTD